MIGIKRRSSIYYPIKEYYKRRIMVGDILGNKTLYADFPDNFVDITNLNETTDNRTICEYNSTSLKNGTKLYFNIPDNITKLYSEYKYTSSTRSKVSSKTPILKATPSTPDPTTDTLINKFLKITYYPDGTVRRASVTNLILTDGSSNIDIFKATYNQSNFYKPEINISTYTVTNTTVISNYNEFDFWSQFILVDETTL